jgi:hypothetical protein
MAEDTNGGGLGGIDPKKFAQGLKIRQLSYLLEKMNSGKDLTVAEQKRLSDYIDGELGSDAGDQDRFENANAVADHYGVGKATVSLAVSRKRITRNGDGTFEKAVTDAYWCDKLGKPKKPIAGSQANGNAAAEVDPSCTISGQIEEQRLRKMKAEALAKELLAQRMSGQLMSRERVDTGWVERAALYREGLMNFVKRLPPLLVNRSQNEIERILDDEARQLLESVIRKGSAVKHAS